MKVLSAEFVTSAAAGAPVGVPHGVPQIALAGRSNVGKSSLINALCRRKIARTSAAPGKTRLANFYRVALEGTGPGRRELYLVDLPGYGYARGGEKSADELRAVGEAYLTRGKRLRPERGAKSPSESSRGWGPASAEKRLRPERPSDTAQGRAKSPSSRQNAQGPVGPEGVLLLIDSRHPDMESDRAAAEWLQQLGVSYHIVATKIDKLSRSERARNLNTLSDTFGTAAVPVSAQSGEGLNELWQLIIRLATNR